MHSDVPTVIAPDEAAFMNAQQCCNLHVNIFRCDHVDTFRCLVDGAAATLMLSTKHVAVLQSTLPIYMLLFADVPNAFRYAIRHSQTPLA